MVPSACRARYWASARSSSRSASSWGLISTAAATPWSVIVILSRVVDARRTSDPKWARASVIGRVSLMTEVYACVRLDACIRCADKLRSKVKTITGELADGAREQPPRPNPNQLAMDFLWGSDEPDVDERGDEPVRDDSDDLLPGVPADR